MFLSLGYTVSNSFNSVEIASRNFFYADVLFKHIYFVLLGN